MKYSEIVSTIDKNLDYLKHHNKNMTKAQDYAVMELQDAIHELFVLIRNNDIKI